MAQNKKEINWKPFKNIGELQDFLKANKGKKWTNLLSEKEE